jgi:hypothetical protein
VTNASCVCIVDGKQCQPDTCHVLVLLVAFFLRILVTYVGETAAHDQA